MAELKDQIAALEPRVAGNPLAMVKLAGLLRSDGQEERALALCREALALAPENSMLAAQVWSFVSSGVPQWHFSIVQDEARNAAYDTALRRVIGPHSRVLEIGTGTGLLAMMAARAGAAEVLTCEMNPAVAEKAKAIVAQNGFAARVHVIGKRSDQLDVETDLDGRVDILVSEIVSNNLLGEEVLPAHEHAVRTFLKPGGRVIPARGRIRIALAEDVHDNQLFLQEVDGFDLSGFNALVSPVRQIRVGHERLSLRSEPTDLFAFDFASPAYCAPARTSLTCRSAGGRVSGIAQWIALDMDDEGRYENRPGAGATSCWGVLFYRFRTPIDTVPGEEVRIGASHDRQSLTLWPESGQSPHAVLLRPPASTMRRYRISGLSVSSEIDLPGAIPAVAEPAHADVTVRRGSIPEKLDAPTASGPNWEIDGKAVLFRVPRLARFLVVEGRDICFALEPGATDRDASDFVLGMSFGILLHQRGALVLHGAAVAQNGRAVAICGQSGVGKSTLAAALCREGCDFVTDDICAVELDAERHPIVLPDGRQLRLWRESIDRLDLSARKGEAVRETFEKYFIEPATSATAAPRLSAIYVLREQRPPFKQGIAPLALPDAMQMLDYEAYRPALRARMGSKGAMLAQAAEMFRHTKAFLFIRPRGFEHMKATVEDLRAHWDALRP